MHLEIRWIYLLLIALLQAMAKASPPIASQVAPEKNFCAAAKVTTSHINYRGTRASQNFSFSQFKKTQSAFANSLEFGNRQVLYKNGSAHFRYQLHAEQYQSQTPRRESDPPLITRRRLPRLTSQSFHWNIRLQLTEQLNATLSSEKTLVKRFPFEGARSPGLAVKPSSRVIDQLEQMAHFNYSLFPGLDVFLAAFSRLEIHHSQQNLSTASPWHLRDLSKSNWILGIEKRCLHGSVPWRLTYRQGPQIYLDPWQDFFLQELRLEIEIPFFRLQLLRIAATYARHSYTCTLLGHSSPTQHKAPSSRQEEHAALELSGSYMLTPTTWLSFDWLSAKNLSQIEQDRNLGVNLMRVALTYTLIGNQSRPKGPRGPQPIFTLKGIPTYGIRQ